MIAQLCNSHGFFHGWLPTQYHHAIFRKITEQVEAEYEGHCIIVDDTWIETIANEETFVKMYPNVMREHVEHIFFVSLLDPPSADCPWNPDQATLQQLTQAQFKHSVPSKSNFQFWAYFCQQEFQAYNHDKQDLPWTGDKLFLSYNRKPASHRTKLVDAFKMRGLMDSGVVTLGHDDPAKAITIEENANVLNDDIDGDVGVPNDIRSIGNEATWKSALVNVVSETVTNGKFLSEKIWKPIIGKRPFLLLGPPGSMRGLQDLGFKTFEDFWDEGYNDWRQADAKRYNQLDDAKSIDEICKILKELQSYSSDQLTRMYNDMEPILEHNYNHFFNQFATDNAWRMNRIIRDEM